MRGNAIATRYARALVDIAFDGGSQKSIRSELEMITKITKDAPDLKRVLSHPGIKLEKRRAILKEVAARLSLSQIIINFLMILIDKRRIHILGEILSEFCKISDEIIGVVRAEVSSAFPLDSGQKAELKKSLGNLTGKQVQIDEEVDSTLIGGIVTRIGGRIYDGSIRTQLEQMGSTLLEKV